MRFERFNYAWHKHIPMASLSKEIEDITITLFSPTKSFNLAGLQASFATFPRAEERKEFDDILGKMDVKRNNPFSLVALKQLMKSVKIG